MDGSQNGPSPMWPPSGRNQLYNLVDVSDIFYFFSARGGGRGSLRHRDGGGGVDFLLKIPGRRQEKGT